MPPLSLTETRWPVLPAKVTVPFCPGTVVVTVTASPPAVVPAVASAGTSRTVAETEPVAVLDAASSSVYVPAVRAVTVSMKPVAPTHPADAAVRPNGSRSLAVEMPQEPKVPSASCTLARCPSARSNTTSAMSPALAIGTDVVTPSATRAVCATSATV